LQVLDPGERFRRPFAFEFFDVTTAVDQEFEDLGERCRAAGSTEAFNRPLSRRCRAEACRARIVVNRSKIKTVISGPEVK